MHINSRARIRARDTGHELFKMYIILCICVYYELYKFILYERVIKIIFIANKLGDSAG